MPEHMFVHIEWLLVAVDACTVALHRLFACIFRFVHSLHFKSMCVCVCVRFIETCDALYVQSLSLRNVSSTEGSGSTMSGSLSMLRPSRLRGSMCSSSSNGKPPSESKHSGTIQSALLMSFDRLGLESSEREKQMMVGECFLPSGKHFLLLQLTVSLPSSWVLTAILFKAIWHWQILKKVLWARTNQSLRPHRHTVSLFMNISAPSWLKIN